MAGGNTATRSAAVREVTVWDLPTRVFHWSLALLVAIAVVSAKTDRMGLHMLAGEAVLTLVLFRVAWGFVGSQTARFSDFVKGPRAVLAYAAGLVRPGTAHEAPATLGHNPMGALMVLALLGVLLTQAASGLFTSDDILVDGPLVPLAGGAAVTLLSTVHRVLANGIIALAGVHILAVLAYLAVKGENLIRPMVTGRKLVAAGTAAVPKRAPVAVAVAVLAVAAGLVAALVAQAG